MNINKVLTKGYENKRLFRRAENKPKQSQRTLIAAPDRDKSGFVIAQIVQTLYNVNMPIDCGNRAEPERPLTENTIRKAQIKVTVMSMLYLVESCQP